MTIAFAKKTILQASISVANGQ